MKKIRFHKLFRYHVRRLAYNIKLLRVLKSISRENTMKKCQLPCCMVFISDCRQLLLSTRTCILQRCNRSSSDFICSEPTLYWLYDSRFFDLYAINIPLMIVAWYQIGHKFTIFTFITVSMSSLFIQFVPVITLTNDPIMNALFGGVVMGTGIGFALRNNISGGERILSV